MKFLPILLIVLLATQASLSAQQVSQSQEKYIKKYAEQKHIVPPAKARLNTDEEPCLSKGFVDLFNGKDLEGWTPRGGHCTFEVVGGVIVGTTVKGSPSTYLSTNREDYSDFIFTAEVKWEVDGNSGIMFRAKRKEGGENDHVFGPQCEMEGINNPRGWSGGIFGQGIGGWRYPLWLGAHSEARSAIKKDDWNRVTIQSIGETTKTWINGIPAAHWVNDEYAAGFFGLQVHAGKKGTVQFRNIRVRELAETSD